MRIALLHYTYPPIVGGVEQVMEEQAALLAADGHEVTVMAGSMDLPVEFLGSRRPPEREARVERIVSLRSMRSRPTPNLEKEADELADLLRPRLAGQQIVLLHNVLTMPFNLPLTAALWRLVDDLPDVRFVAWVHDVAAANPDYVIPSEAPWSFLRSAHPRIEYVAVSELRRRQVVETMGAASSQCRVIPNGIALLDRLAMPPALWDRAVEGRWLERDILLFHPARLLRRKHVERSLEVTAALRATGRDAALLVTAARDPHQAASTAYAASLRELRAQLHLTEHADFLGDFLSLTDAAVDSLYRVADAVLFPSLQEGFGLPLLEAALHRTPIFFPDREPLSGLLPGAGFAYPPAASPIEIAALVLRQVEASPTIQKRKALFRSYSWPSVYVNFLAPLLAGGHNSP